MFRRFKSSIQFCGVGWGRMKNREPSFSLSFFLYFFLSFPPKFKTVFLFFVYVPGFFVVVWRR